MINTGFSSLLAKRHANKTVFYWALGASLMANILGLGSSLYSIQIFNRYVGYGLDGTLITLTLGAVLALLLEFVFRSIRARLMTGLLTPQDAIDHQQLLQQLLHTRNDQILNQPANHIFNTLKQQQQLQNLHSAQNLLVLMDFPFALIFVFCVFLLLPTLGVVVVLMASVSLVLAYFQYRKNLALQQQFVEAGNALDASLSNGAQHSTVASFNVAPLLLERHRQPLVHWLTLRKQQTEAQQVQQNSSQLLNGFTSVAVIGIGAIAVTTGAFDIGSLIGANILAMRAINVINQTGRVWQTMSQANALQQELAKAYDLELEQNEGARPKSYQGGVALKGIVHGYDERQAPIINQFNFNLKAGEIICICGVNGRGKTTLAKIMVGLLQPNQGQVLVDGVDMRQLSMTWWRSNIAYVPQEPAFLNLSLKDNLAAEDDDDSERLREVIEQCGLQAMIDQHPDGIHQKIRAGGQHFPPGLRKRLALARALLSEGQLLILDEAQEGMDHQGRQILAKVLQQQLAAGKTIILFSSDKSVVTDAAHIFDLDTGQFTQRKGVIRAV